MGFEIRSTSATTVLLVLVFAAANLVEESAGATTYVVGDSIGWTIPKDGAGSYASWSSRHTFSPGDVLLFNFPTGVHDVAKVDKTSFDTCSASNPSSLATVGPATVTLISAGEHYFICTFGQHCSSGQKLTLKVSGATPPAAATSPPPAPVAAPPTSTKPVAPPTSTTSSPPPSAAAATPKAAPTPVTTPSPTSAASSPKATPSSAPTTVTAPTPATPSTSTTPPVMTPSSSATPPSSTVPMTPASAPAPTAGGLIPGGPEVPAAQSPGGAAAAPGPSDSSHPKGLATKTTATSTVMGLIVAIVGGIAFIGY